MTQTLAHTATEAPPQSEPITFEQYVAREDERKADLIDGYLIHDMPTDRHEDLFAFLLSVLRIYTEERELGIVRGSRTPIRLGHRGGLEPDLIFVQAARVEIVQQDHLSGAPDLAVEIVSPSSVKRDYETKRAAYERLGVREYWLLDVVNDAARFFRLGEDGLFADVTPRRPGEPFASRAVPGFEIDPACLLADELPRVWTFVSDLLDGRR